MDENVRKLVEAIHREAVEASRGQPFPPVQLPTVHFTDLPEASPGEPLALEWNTYRREVGRLLTEGQEGKFVLIKDGTIIGLFDAWDAARAAGLHRYLLEPFLVHEVRAEEPYLRIRGLNFPWPNSRSR
jgi:hypothetical protein